MRHKVAVLSCILTSACFSADPALTIYNQQFAVVRETIPLELKPGINQVEFTGTTAQLEAASVMLRDPSGQRVLRILEQNYRADPVSLEALMKRYEGRTIEFQVRNGERIETVNGKIVRAGSSRPGAAVMSSYPPAQPSLSQTIIEVAGKLRFDLPGVPLFPGLGAGMILKPTLDWTIETDRAGRLDAELGYVTGGFNWNADYNIVQGDSKALDIIGWVTMENRSGKEFENSRVKLMAGDVNKISPNDGRAFRVGGGVGGGVIGGIMSGPPVTEKTFDEYHLYTLQRPVTLHDMESKQVEFVRAEGVKSDIVYVYDGMKVDTSRYRSYPPEALRNDSSYGTLANSKVWVMREFVNSDANRLGMPLPKGRVRFYRRDTDGRLEFTGEDTIDHTPKDERIRVFTGAAFDLTGERKRTIFRNDMGRSMMDEAFEIKVRNHKKEPVEVRVVEHLYRWSTWEISTNSMPYTKTDAQTIEFRVPLQPDEEKTITYAAHYTW